jgi:TusA-related sulfurtransferase
MVDLTGRVMEVDRTLNEVKTSLESPMPEVAVKDTIKQAMTGLELVVTVHIDSLNGVR